MSSVPNFLLVALYISHGVQAAPWPLHSSHSTHHTPHLARSLGLETFQPPSIFKTFGGVESPIPEEFHEKFIPEKIEESAIKSFQVCFNLDAGQIGYRSGFSRGSQSYAYVNQVHNGIPFSNAVGNIVWNDGKIVACSSSFVILREIADPIPSLSVQDIIPVAEQTFRGKYNDIPPRLEYLVRGEGSCSLVHVIQIVNEDEGTWFEAFVDAHTGKLLSVTDFVAHDSYTAVPITRLVGQEVISDPSDPLASPAGWVKEEKFTLGEPAYFTSGNNVIAYTGLGVPAKQTSEGPNFNTEYDDTEDPTVASNQQAAKVNAFYVINSVHDVTYRYGFTEDAFNFQQDNFEKGGKSNDPVRVSVQDSTGTNNANFATPPDGQPGTCRMYIWNLANPRRDGAMENDILVHEMTHGVTNRLTGGGTGRCLQTLEAGGMGEGWSDAMADWITQTSAPIEDFVLGAYVTNKSAGIRTHPYSTNPHVNPLRYSSIAQLKEVHPMIVDSNVFRTEIGEVWATILHEVLSALVDVYGISRNARTNPDSLEGNVVFMHLFIDSLSIQPCNPTLPNSREAWILADQARYHGKNKCILWKAFADRGLGVNATNFVDSLEVPMECREKSES
ncbi:hypothetical protein C0995_000066 [Termitomyces sp. Mi166|nr:hypothetical protein C0995_000066 [Termitomyces sp. Mi166\